MAGEGGEAEREVEGLDAGVFLIGFEVEGMAVVFFCEVDGVGDGGFAEALVAVGGEDEEFVEEGKTAAAFEGVAVGESEEAGERGIGVDEADEAEGIVVEELRGGVRDGGGVFEVFAGVELALEGKHGGEIGAGRLGE